jgi:hypothetical protein
MGALLLSIHDRDIFLLVGIEPSFAPRSPCSSQGPRASA